MPSIMKSAKSFWLESLLSPATSNTCMSRLPPAWASPGPRAVLAGELAPLEVEGVAVGVVRRAAEDRAPAVVLRPAELPVVGNVAPHQIPPLTAPGRSLRPERPRPQTQDRGVSLPEAVE